MNYYNIFLFNIKGFGGAGDLATLVDNGQDLPFGLFGLVAKELRRSMLFGDLEPDLGILGLARTGPGGARHGLLCIHGRVEAGHIHTALRQVPSARAKISNP